MQDEGRSEAQREIVKRIARIATYIVPDDEGVDLCFINSTEEGSRLKANEVEAIMSRVEPAGATELGTNLVRKILKPLVYDKLDRKERLRRPVLVSVVTDGCPGGHRGSPERPDTFKEAIVECGQRLMKAGYEPEGDIFALF